MTDDDNLPRIEYKKILYMTDLSESGRDAFPYAASIANRYDAELTVFHAVEAMDFEKYLVGYISEALWDEIKNKNLQEAREILIHRKRHDAAISNSIEELCQESMSKADRPYVKYEVAVDVGDPVEKALEKAQGEGYDLVVIGKHGHGALKGAMMGNTAQRLIRRCKVPVLVVDVSPSESKD
jgi:nucleotide-binding universal stress UspA family protein